MCCGRKKPRSRRGKSGKITRSSILSQEIISNDQEYSKDRERLQYPSDRQHATETGTVGTPEVQG